MVKNKTSSMVRTCADKLCPTGRSGAAEDEKAPSLYKFREEWRSVLPNEVQSADPRLCALHFTEDCFYSDRIDKRFSRGVELINRNLKPGVMPTIWVNHPWFYRPRETSLATAEAREEAANRLSLDEEDGEFSSIGDIILKVRDDDDIEIQTAKDNDRLSLFKVALVENNTPTVIYGLTVSEDLTISPFCDDNLVDLKKLGLNYGAKLRRYSDLNEIFESLDSYRKNQSSDSRARNSVQSAINSLSTPELSSNKTVVFIIEQLDLLFRKARGRRFSSSLFSLAIIIHTISSACYRQILDDGLIIFPTERRIRSLVSGITPALGLAQSILLYLKIRFGKLSDKDKIVSVLLDEIPYR